MPITPQIVVRSTLTLLGIGFAALLFVVMTTMWLGDRAQRHVGEVARAGELRSTATQLRESLLTAESSQRGFLLTGNEIYLAPYDNATTVTRSKLERLRALLADQPDRAPLVAQLSSVLADKLAEQDRSIALKKSGADGTALDVVRSNRGKALMDEASIYLSAVVLQANDRLSAAVAEQTSNTEWLRWTSAASAVVIILVVTGVLATIHRYTSEITTARDETRSLNETLELRVAERTEELARARDRAEVLLAEVNHRVANSLALVSSLVRLQSRDLQEPVAKAALQDVDGRIQAIAEMHKHLFTTGGAGEVAVDAYLSTVLSQLESAMAANGSSVRLRRELVPVTLQTSDAINLGIIVTEWVTNAFKYAYGDGQGEVRVCLARSADGMVVSVEDDGIGRPSDVKAKGTGLGTRVVSTIATLMKATVTYRQRHPGTEARLTLPVYPSTPLTAAS